MGSGFGYSERRVAYGDPQSPSQYQATASVQRPGIITLISREQAQVGSRFRVYSIPEECMGCRLYAVCMGRLVPKRVYEVVEVRKGLGQRCPLTGSEMVPVVVLHVPIRVLVPDRHALEGAIITYDYWCDCEDCVRDPMLRRGEKVKVLRVVGRKSCNGKEYSLVEVVPAH